MDLEETEEREEDEWPAARFFVGFSLLLSLIPFSSLFAKRGEHLTDTARATDSDGVGGDMTTVWEVEEGGGGGEEQERSPVGDIRDVK